MVHANADEIRQFAGLVAAFRERCSEDLTILDASLRGLLSEAPDPSLMRYCEVFNATVSSLHRGLEELEVGERRLLALAASVEYLSFGVLPLTPTSPTRALPAASPVAGYRLGRGFQTRRGAIPLTQVGAHALRDNIVWDDDFAESFWRTRHHNYDATDYIALVSALPQVLTLLRRNQNPSESENDQIRQAYEAYFSENNRIIIEKHPEGWRVTDGRHRIMASIAANIPCLAQMKDVR